MCDQSQRHARPSLKSIFIALISLSIWSPALAQTLPIEAGSWGGKVRSGPGTPHLQVASLQNGDAVTLIEQTDDVMNGYPWFRIRFGENQIGYQWGVSSTGTAWRSTVFSKFVKP